MTGSVKDLIRSIRSCKTPAEERSIIAKESAEIRSSLNGDSNSTRKKNISKMLLIHLMGYSTSFGQMECVKLIASSKFADKRVGYLAINLLLHEDTDVLTLAINSIKMDLNSTNTYVVELALNAISNIGNTEMFRELSYDIEKLMKSPMVNIRKKAVICASRMLRKLGQLSLIPGPEAIEIASNYVHLVPGLLVDPNHGIIYAGLAVLSALMEYFPMCLNYTSIYDLLIKTFHTICNETGNALGIVFGSSQEYDVNGVNDPFLKCKLLCLIRNVYGKCRQQLPSNQQLYDIVSGLLKSATQTNNATNALLYESVRTIYTEFHDPKFNQLGKDIVQKFMATNDNNIKYIALDILNNLVDVSLEVGNTNWTIIVQSLRQPDISIRRRALDVALKLVTRDTLKPLMQYLYDFLLASSDELKRESISKIAISIERHAEQEYYKLEWMVKIFAISGNCTPEPILHSFIASVSTTSQENQVRIATKLYHLVRNNMGQEALVRAALWCLGEYSHLLRELSLVDITPSNSMTAQGGEPMEQTQEQKNDLISLMSDTIVLESAQSNVSANSHTEYSGYHHIITVVEAIGKHIMTHSVTRNVSCTDGEYLLTCVGKICCRIPEVSNKLMPLVRGFKKHTNVELQQRACELEMLHATNMMNVLCPTGLTNVSRGLSFASLDLSSDIPREEPQSFKLLDISPRMDDNVLKLDPQQQKKSGEKLSTLDFISLDYSTNESKTKAKDDFGELDPFY